MLRRIRKMLKDQKGFTLVELMAVIAIIGVLAAIAIPRYMDATKEAQAAKILADLHAIDSAVAMYNAANSAYPTYDTASLVTAPNTYLAALPTPAAGTYGIDATSHLATWTAVDTTSVFGSTSTIAAIKAKL